MFSCIDRIEIQKLNEWLAVWGKEPLASLRLATSSLEVCFISLCSMLCGCVGKLDVCLSISAAVAGCPIPGAGLRFVSQLVCELVC